MTRFDWYQATVYVGHPDEKGLLDHLLSAWDMTDLAPFPAMHGYTHGAQIVRSGEKFCHLWWGGNTGVNITASSEHAPVLAEALRTWSKSSAINQELGPIYAVTRVDSCADWVEEGAFDSLSAHFLQYAERNGLAICQQGDWLRGEGRTLYVGSKDSPVRVCIYEKGYEQRAKHGGNAPLDWCRLEVRVKPKGIARMAVAGWSPTECMHVGWVAEALGFLGWAGLEKRAVGTVWRPDDTLRARRALAKQYSRLIKEWAADAGGYEGFGRELEQLRQEQIEEEKASRRAATHATGTTISNEV